MDHSYEQSPFNEIIILYGYNYMHSVECDVHQPIVSFTVDYRLHATIYIFIEDSLAALHRCEITRVLKLCCI